MSYSDEHDGWFSPGAIEVRRQTGWAVQLTAKANRILLQPVLNEFGEDCVDDDMQSLVSRTMEGVRSAEITAPILLNGLGDLGARLCSAPPEIPILSEELIGRLFPCYYAILRRGLRDPEADPYNMYLSYLDQIGLIAAQMGWAIGIAEDDIANGGGIYSWIPPERFQQAGEMHELIEPAKVTGDNLVNFGDGIRKELGADRLLFVLTRDIEVNGSPKDEHEASQSEPDFSGVERDDLIPFVRLGLNLISRGDCVPNPYTAADMVVRKCGFTAKQTWSKESGKVRASTFKAAVDVVGRELSPFVKKNKKGD